MKGPLVVIPRGQKKIWNKYPNAGPTPARDACRGATFTVNRRYAECYDERWLILSAKYGLISPDYVLTGPYNVTFKDPPTHPVSATVLVSQLGKLSLEGIDAVICLGGTEYREMKAAFLGKPLSLYFPFAGLPLGKSMQAINAAISAEQPFPAHFTMPAGSSSPK